MAVSDGFFSCLAVYFLIRRFCERRGRGRCQLGAAACAPLRSDTEGLCPGNRHRSCLPFHEPLLHFPAWVQTHGFLCDIWPKINLLKASHKQNKRKTMQRAAFYTAPSRLCSLHSHLISGNDSRSCCLSCNVQSGRVPS